jgi:hypothetical protein
MAEAAGARKHAIRTRASARAARAQVSQSMRADPNRMASWSGRSFPPNGTTEAHEPRLNNRPAVNRLGLVCGMLFAAVFTSAAALAVSPQQAEQLKTSLTPIGAERAGNKEGTIPPWSGGFAAAAPGYRASAPHADPFALEKPLFSITAANWDKYADKLPEGAKALLRKYPDYRMDIYPTHRTAAFPASVIDSVYRNATRAHAAPEGIAFGVEGAAGGIPFPIPKNGFEVVWNHLLAYWGPARELHVNTYVVSPDGT